MGTRGEEALVAACVYGHEEVALILIDAGVILSSQKPTPPWIGSNSIASHAMEAAVKNGLVVVMKKFLDTGSVNSNDSVLYWGCLLNIGAHYGEAEAVSLLLEYGAEINGGAIGETPLCSAVAGGYVEEATILLDKGVDVMARSPNEGHTTLHVTAVNGQIPTMQLLLARDAEISARNSSGVTPLHSAARVGKLAVVQFLLQKGADINARDGEHWTPAHRAAWNKHRDVLDLLGAMGADMDRETDGGLTVADLLEGTDEDGSEKEP
jgi:hypothetical protein